MSLLDSAKKHGGSAQCRLQRVHIMVLSTVCYWVRVNACTCCSVCPCRAFWARTHAHLYGKHGSAQIRSKVAMKMRSVSITNLYLTIEEATRQVCRLTAPLCPGSAIFRISFRFLPFQRSTVVALYHEVMGAMLPSAAAKGPPRSTRKITSPSHDRFDDNTLKIPSRKDN